MRRGFAIVVLGLGTVLGFGWGIARVSGYCPGGCEHGSYGPGAWGPHAHRFEDRAADACVRAAERVLAERRVPSPGAAPAPAPAAPAAPAP